VIARSPCSCTTTLPTKVTVISSPLQGLMSVKTSRMGSSTGGVGGRRDGERQSNDAQQANNESLHDHTSPQDYGI
jgi:hypothetical protein